MAKAHKIIYQPTDRKQPWALEISVYYDDETFKVFDVSAAVFHEGLPNTVRSFYHPVYGDYFKAFKVIWHEMERLSLSYSDFIISKADYNMTFAQFERMLENGVQFD